MEANSINASDPFGMGTSADILSAPVHSMGMLLQEHQAGLAAVCGASLILGGLLSRNMLWHLQVISCTEMWRSNYVNGSQLFLILRTF